MLLRGSNARTLSIVGVLLVMLIAGCDDDGDGPSDAGGDSRVLDGTSDLSEDAGLDAEGLDTDSPDLAPECAAMTSAGFFPDCTACLDASNCDEIDAPGASGRACGCSASTACPCGLSCGSYEIAPGIGVSGICVTM